MSDLTPLELRIVCLIADGKTDRQIAGLLNLKENTVGCYLREIYSKLDVRSRTQLIKRVFDLKLKPEFGGAY
ncbi:MAG TPA: LuxR family transcriptional regulator [Herpetosiphon sp.]|uniref:Transcriptional regulator, LuxR family n=1 Tax=Herpetosiphon aurantiacus (strain ATCC 23779 / DSM 785 / 114-95) TaxID=316274 RepID=A9B7W8_HERA2|nr:helix-turn-helix transcriptional regulator [Herpetosiphon sp.]ABX04496.1 transcriptional regulator, LuxR family [Herpetosiphon aurantiacus DSM 785]HBW52251.1 LuxR family transcriptional regulator [Herpetosiphon sp.]